MILSVKDLVFKYPSRSVLENIAFGVAPGECLAVLGPNGAGKSTLLKCLNRILKPQAGIVYICENEVLKLSKGELAQKMGYVPQQQERARITVFDAILLGRRPYIKWDATRHDRHIVTQVMEMLELEDYAMRFIDELSGGELQKVVIARALAQEPDLLLLDEPTSSLDLKNQMEVIRLIKSVVENNNIAAIITMHDLNLALRFADKFIMLKNSTIYASGGREIITAENIESVYSLPVKVRVFDTIPLVIPI
jgi:iron complex transport system ATP-binding protein